MVLETNRSRLLNVWGGAEEEQRKFKSGCPSPPYSLLLLCCAQGQGRGRGGLAFWLLLRQMKGTQLTLGRGKSDV